MLTGTASSLELSNGLLSRRFALKPAFGTVDLLNLNTNESALRSILPEGSLTINGTAYVLGGLTVKAVPSSTGPKFTG